MKCVEFFVAPHKACRRRSWLTLKKSYVSLSNVTVMLLLVHVALALESEMKKKKNKKLWRQIPVLSDWKSSIFHSYA